MDSMSQDESQSLSSHIDVGFFIEAIQNYPYLYDLKDSRSKDQKLKLRSWQELAEIFNTTTEDCQKFWKSLRDKFVKEKNKRGSSGSEAPDSNWEFFDKMLFYGKYTKPRKTFTNAVASPSVQDTDIFSGAATEGSVWSSYWTLVASNDGPSGGEREESTPSTSKVAKKRKAPTEFDSLLATAKRICDKIEGEEPVKTTNFKFGEYLAARLDEMDAETARDKRKKISFFVFYVTFQ